MNDLSDCLTFLLAKAYQKAHGKFKSVLQGYGLTTVQHLVLEALWIEDGLTASEISKRLVLDNATLSGVLDRMTDAGWIIKRPDREDRRYIRIYLSPKSIDKKPVLIEVRDMVNNEIQTNFTAEERMLLKRLLKDIM
jgi:DNA-binding MarR family transcriptional regulator